MLQGSLALLAKQSFLFLRRLALYRQIKRSGHSEENYSVSSDIVLQRSVDSAGAMSTTIWTRHTS
jgi:hypothetical protein